MKVKEFVTKYNSAPGGAKERMISELITTDYVPYEEKVVTAQTIVEQAYSEKINTPILHLIFYKTLVSKYTSLEFNEEDGRANMEDFNLLNRYGIIDLILAAINEDEISEFTSVKDMVVTDYVTNNYNVGAMFTKIIESLGNVLTEFTKEENLEVIKKYIESSK